MIVGSFWIANERTMTLLNMLNLVFLRQKSASSKVIVRLRRILAKKKTQKFKTIQKSYGWIVIFPNTFNT